jgi:tetratricopeptide (TPR) repeat protein
LCKQHLPDEPELVSGRIIYALALFRAGQMESASEEFYRILSRDPENLVALKYLGDIKFAQGDEFAAMANFARILEIDPYTRGVCGRLAKQPAETTTTITLRRGTEASPDSDSTPLRQVPFVTETMGDLYLAQGHSRLAAAVFRSLQQQAGNPRLAEKLAQAEHNVKEKDRKE